MEKSHWSYRQEGREEETLEKGEGYSTFMLIKRAQQNKEGSKSSFTRKLILSMTAKAYITIVGRGGES